MRRRDDEEMLVRDAGISGICISVNPYRYSKRVLLYVEVLRKAWIILLRFHRRGQQQRQVASASSTLKPCKALSDVRVNDQLSMSRHPVYTCAAHVNMPTPNYTLPSTALPSPPLLPIPTPPVMG